MNVCKDGDTAQGRREISQLLSGKSAIAPTPVCSIIKKRLFFLVFGILLLLFCFETGLNAAQPSLKLLCLGKE